MKPYRVKRGGKLVGSFIVVHGGKRVNLGTKDASEARRRAMLVAKGQWPPTGNAASAVKAALEGKEPDPDEVDEGQNDAVGGVQAVSVETLGAGDVVSPAPAPAPVPAPVGAIEDPAPIAAADAVNAAAAAEDEALFDEVKAELAAQGVDLGEIKAEMPKLLSGAHLWLQGQLCRTGLRFAKGRWPAMVTLPPEDGLRQLLGKLDVALMARWNLDVDRIGPGWMLLILSAVTAIAQVGGMMEAMQVEEDAAKKAVN